MRRLLLTSTLAVAALSLGACAAHSPAPHNPAPLGGPASRAVELPGPPGEGKPRESKVLVDEPALKLVSMVLRDGTVLPLHHSAVAVTISALQGKGAVVVGSQRLPLDPTHAVVLAAGVQHTVEPEPGTDLVLLVHHLGRAEEHHP